MVRIRITPEQVDDVARQFEGASQESSQMVSRLESTMSNLAAEWEGVSKERFYQDYEQWRTNMRQFVELLDSIGKQLHATAERFRVTDQGA
ncbi:MAG: WXG100 family type VII secretion target [Anaerolineae bacterium]|nr:WXG100 family type VII secretion target [Anaerolineae bacterium]